MRCRRPPILTTIVTAAAFSLLVSGCGSSSPSSSSASSSGGSPTQAQLQQGQQDLIRFSECMRSHGVANFPDPGSGAFKRAFVSQSPASVSAVKACEHLMPGGGPPSQSPAQSQAQIAAMLAFARCIRSHGFPSFPDPTSSGELNHQMVANAGINLNQPAVLQAGDACVGVTHGIITKAIVARFVAGQ